MGASSFTFEAYDETGVLIGTYASTDTSHPCGTISYTFVPVVDEPHTPWVPVTALSPFEIDAETGEFRLMSTEAWPVAAGSNVVSYYEFDVQVDFTLSEGSITLTFLKTALFAFVDGCSTNA